jgi:transcriptional regulator of arginine metabolism
MKLRNGQTMGETKRRRQRALLELVRTAPLSTQHEIQRRLAELGHDATQSTISRDLEELGLVRVRDGEGRLRYTLATEAATAAASGRLKSMLNEYAVSIESSGNLVVIVTPPGAANPLADAMDHVPVDGVVGTVAGDNTILVIAREGVRGSLVAERLRKIGGIG